MKGRSIRRPSLFSVFSTCTVHVTFSHSLPSRVGCSFQGKLFSVFKLLCLVFVRYYLSSCTALEKIYSPIQDLFCLRKPLTYPGSASVQCGLPGRTDYPLSQALTFFTQTSVSYWNSDLSNEYKFIYVPR